MTGFQTWWKLQPKVQSHEISEQHLTCFEKWKTLRAIELVSKYDPVLREHFIKLELAGQSLTGKILTSYMSPTTQNEFITLLNENVKKKFCLVLRKQNITALTLTVHQTSHTLIRCESFLGYFELTGKKALNITEDIIKIINRIGWISHCVEVRVSTHIWAIFVTNVRVTVKRLSDTRFSAHYEPVKLLHVNFKKIVGTIEELCDPTETVETRGVAQTLLPTVCDFSVLCS
ncbi:hypothetical protein PR048_028642 [Dryococelus australis]|uniref:Uncharacterized protein n=1 Tax=Dryococelus australis TaxID=614101 RepID=A0ABQ9GB56_9NEOP|nr:hypothetical protein PR048_028642 [Dryococelus australis]